MTKIELIKDIVENNQRNFSTIIRAKKNIELLSWIIDNTPKELDTLISKIYYLLNTDKQQTVKCKNGNYQHILHINDDNWVFCGKIGYCQCATESAITTRKSTNKKKYGCENPQQNKEIKHKTQKTNIERYGYITPLQNEEIREKIKETNLEKYGVENISQLDKIKQTKIETTQRSYGVNYPFQNEEIREKIKETNLEKYGFEYPVQSDFVKRKIKNTNTERYGVESYYQRHILNYNIWIDRELFIEYIFDKDINSILDFFNVTYTTLKYKSVEYGCDNIFFDKIKASKSRYEDEISLFLNENNISHVSNNKTLLANNRELDFYIPDYNLAIEFNGIYWHSELSGNKDRKFHLRKTNECNDLNIQLIHIFEDEWNNKKEIIKKLILHKCQKTNETIYARKLKVVKLTNNNVMEFLNETHIQGYTLAKFNYALVNTDDEIKATMTFSKSRFDKEDAWEIVRYATNGNIVGGASKLLAAFIKNNDPKKIISYCDLRYGNGNMYEKIGFTLNSVSSPGYFYTDYKKRFNRMQFQKHKLIKEGFDSSKTEWQIMQEKGYDRIWDCGHKKYIWIKS